eukprot:TRINITY_DN3083_c0_g1_i2.p1 TRINITY_DN3083_c0_g1~~TRINITY_DN3083_c0_g1_i2.p1  ORF type:complete len:324 (-),score=51.07 TRINITY_DN3083_c0_g1_i2:131-1102(-)
MSGKRKGGSKKNSKGRSSSKKKNSDKTERQERTGGDGSSTPGGVEHRTISKTSLDEATLRELLYLRQAIKICITPSIPSKERASCFLRGLEKSYEIACYGCVFFQNICTSLNENENYKLHPSYFLSQEEYKEMCARCLKCNRRIQLRGFYCLEVCEIRGRTTIDVRLKFMGRLLCFSCAPPEPNTRVYHVQFAAASETIGKYVSLNCSPFRPRPIIPLHYMKECRVCNSPSLECDLDMNSKTSLTKVKFKSGDEIQVIFYLCSKECKRTWNAMMEYGESFLKSIIAEEVCELDRTTLIDQLCSALFQVQLGKGPPVLIKSIAL